MKKKLIRLTENDLHRIVKGSVNKIIKESVDDRDFQDNVKQAIYYLYSLEQKLKRETELDEDLPFSIQEIYDACRKARKSIECLDSTAFYRTNGGIFDFKGNSVQDAIGDGNDNYTRDQEMRGPMGY